ncbi:MAG: hypothetical protein Q9M92_14110 [Enterobacterales bacterium]|nr:hypothetical protein [Enterobacterales bacterium]
MFNAQMKRFYPDFCTINAFTLSLDYHQNELECAHCSKHDQFVSHGIIYKQRSSAFAEKVGKRISAPIGMVEQAVVALSNSIPLTKSHLFDMARLICLFLSTR